MTECYLLRHAHAGSRGAQDDECRVLSPRGRAQAAALVEQFRDVGITRILTSPYSRCVETVAPLGAALGVTPERVDALGEGAGPDGALAIVTRATAPTLLCSHGDVLGELITAAARAGTPIEDDRLQKAGTWVLIVDGGRITGARYLPPPAGP